MSGTPAQRAQARAMHRAIAFFVTALEEEFAAAGLGDAAELLVNTEHRHAVLLAADDGKKPCVAVWLVSFSRAPEDVTRELAAAKGIGQLIDRGNA